jgi:hypothetical protein
MDCVEFVLPVDLFSVVGRHMSRLDVFALSVSCKGARRGLTERREPLVDWLVARCAGVTSPLTCAVALISGDVSWRRRGVDVELVAPVLEALLGRPAAPCVLDAMRALRACARGYERALDVLLRAAVLSGLVAVPDADAMAAIQRALVLEYRYRATRDDAPVTRFEAAYRALLRARSRGIVARLLDWAPEVEPELGGQNSLVHLACRARRSGVVLEVLARRGALPGFRAAMLVRNDASRLDAPLSLACGLRGEDAESLAIVRALLDAGAWHSPRRLRPRQRVQPAPRARPTNRPRRNHRHPRIQPGSRQRTPRRHPRRRRPHPARPRPRRQGHAPRRRSRPRRASVGPAVGPRVIRACSAQPKCAAASVECTKKRLH